MGNTKTHSCGLSDNARGGGSGAAAARISVLAPRLLLWALALAVVLSSLHDLGWFATIDEEMAWHRHRLVNFWGALRDGDLSDRASLKVCDKPGIMSAWIAGGGYIALRKLDGPLDRSPLAPLVEALKDYCFDRDDPAYDCLVATRTVQRFFAYAACVLTWFVCAWALSRAFFSDDAPGRIATPFLFLLLATCPPIRMYSRLVLPDGMAAAFGFLSVSLVLLAATRRSNRARALVLAVAGVVAMFSLLSKYSGFFSVSFALAIIVLWSCAPILRDDDTSFWRRLALVFRTMIPKLLSFILPCLLTGYVLQPYAWTHPVEVFAVGKSLAPFLKPGLVVVAAMSALCAAIAGLAIVCRFRRRIVAMRADAVFAVSLAMALAMTGLIVAGLIWRQDGLQIYPKGGAPATLAESGVHYWQYRSIYTYNTGRVMSQVLHLKRAIICMSASTPLMLLVPMILAPLAIASSCRRRKTTAAPTLALLAAMQLFLLFLLVIYSIPLFPTSARYLLVTYFPWTVAAGLSLLLLALLIPRLGAGIVIVYASCLVLVHFLILPYNLSFTNAAYLNPGAHGNEWGQNLVHVARFMNGRYLAASEEQRAHMNVLADYVGFKEFYLGRAQFTECIEESDLSVYDYILVTPKRLGVSAAARKLMAECEPVYVARHQRLEFAWLFETRKCQEALPGDP